MHKDVRSAFQVPQIRHRVHDAAASKGSTGPRSITPCKAITLEGKQLPLRTADDRRGRLYDKRRGMMRSNYISILSQRSLLKAELAGY
jgi:hypothetical protein